MNVCRWRWWKRQGIAHKPKMFVLHNVQRACVSGMLFRDSPSFHLLMRGDRMSIVGCRVEAGFGNCDGYGPQPNTDAFHTHGTNIFLHDLFAHNGDDGFPVEPSGYAEDTRNVLVDSCHAECGSNAGVVIVGEYDGNKGGPVSVRDVIFRNVTANRTNQGGGIKISEPYETVNGNATNITWDGLSVINPRAAALYVNVFEENAQVGKSYGCTMPNASVLAHDVKWMSARGIRFRNVHVSGLVPPALGACFNCAPGTPCDVALEDADVQGKVVCHNAGKGVKRCESSSLPLALKGDDVAARALLPREGSGGPPKLYV